ncbi:MAG: hypothetical protein WBM22_18675, partial [Pseudomonas fluorescens]
DTGNQVRCALRPIVQDLQKEILRPLSEAERECFVNFARQVVWRGDAPDASGSKNAVRLETATGGVGLVSR